MTLLWDFNFKTVTLPELRIICGNEMITAEKMTKHYDRAYSPIDGGGMIIGGDGLEPLTWYDVAIIRAVGDETDRVLIKSHDENPELPTGYSIVRRMPFFMTDRNRNIVTGRGR